MKRIFAYFISLLLVAPGSISFAQDTLGYPLRIRVGLDLYGPGNYIFNKNIQNYEGFVSVEIDSSRAIAAEAGWADYSFSQYNYSYRSSGMFLKLGMDYNLLKPVASEAKYYAGVGLRYGLSVFSHEFPDFSSANYWGESTGSVGESVRAAHFLEASPGVRAELFRGMSVGWAVRLRLMIYSGTGKNVKAIYIPGYGNGTRPLSPAISYYLIWNFTYKRI